MPSDTVIKVALRDRAYAIRYLADFSELPRYFDDGRKRFALIDVAVDRLYGREFRRLLKGVTFIRVPQGEKSKSFQILERIANELTRLGANRKSELVAIGGGVVGDLAGFLAGIFMRGIPFVQIPTTLLAMVDSSVGGKTAVNIAAGKNLVGLFHQPRAVFILPQMLKTLPLAELKCGLSEAIKTALIGDIKLVRYLESFPYDSKKPTIDFLHEVSARSIAIKARIVAKDEREENIRASLNFGHTLAHALEAQAKYTGILHGLAVAIGQRYAALVSRRAGHLGSAEEARIEGLLHKYSLPRRLNKGQADLKGLIRLMRADKKNHADGIRFVCLRGLGSSRLPESISEQELLASLKEFQSLSA